ncbi:MAG: ornithine carbamoyltransferase [Candidatus Omnitrophica bacterium]|nr:ornithine carbamoyltransferase [Candidatus Omnitrophota bacterium]
MKKRDFISIDCLSKEEILRLFGTAMEMKHDRSHSANLLKGKTIGLIFQKPSNRTRVSFEVGISQMAGNCVYLGPEEINLGIRESTADVAKTLSRYLNGIVARTYDHDDVIELAKNATIPIINGLSDLYHPCQGLTDIFSIREKFKRLEGLTIAYVGDGNNVCHSLMLGAAKLGVNVNISTPKGYEPNSVIVQDATKLALESHANLTLFSSPQDAVHKAHVIYADVWVSMGQEDEREKRLKDFQGFQINSELAALADPNYIFMHCLPAHRGEEVTADIIDGPHSIVFDQAENRLHIQKAIMNFIFNTW